MPNTNKINSEMEVFNSKCDKIQTFLDEKVTTNLNASVLDKVGVRLEKLFNDVQSYSARTPEMSPSQQIAFLTKLRGVCVTLGQLQMFLVKYTQNNVKDLEKPLEQTMEVIEDKVESFEEVSEIIDLQEEKGRALTLGNGQFAA